jgi:hypothetical protein
MNDTKAFNSNNLIDELYIASMMQTTYLQCLHGVFLAYVEVHDQKHLEKLEHQFQDSFAKLALENFSRSKLPQALAQDAIEEFLKGLPGISPSK